MSLLHECLAILFEDSGIGHHELRGWSMAYNFKESPDREALIIDARKVATFKSSAVLRDTLNSGS
jgi:hypothetical protein